MIENRPHIQACRLGEIANVFGGFSPYGRSPAGKGNHVVGMLTIRNIVDGAVLVQDVETVTVETPEKLAGYRLQPDDILLSARGSSFRAGLCGEAVSGLIAGSNTLVIRLAPDAPIGAALLVALFNAPNGEAMLASVADCGTIRSLKPKTLQDLRIALPSREHASKLEEYCRVHEASRRASLKAIASQQNILNGLLEPLLSFI